jgi:type III secretion system FlhB-like substrate exporter
VGQGIPAKLYTTVAEVLAFVYRAQAQVRQKGVPQPAR